MPYFVAALPALFAIGVIGMFYSVARGRARTALLFGSIGAGAAILAVWLAGDAVDLWEGVTWGIRAALYSPVIQASLVMAALILGVAAVVGLLVHRRRRGGRGRSSTDNG